jgi:hypothetical protein
VTGFAWSSGSIQNRFYMQGVVAPAVCSPGTLCPVVGTRSLLCLQFGRTRCWQEVSAPKMFFTDFGTADSAHCLNYVLPGLSTPNEFPAVRKIPFLTGSRNCNYLLHNIKTMNTHKTQKNISYSI